MTQVTCRLTAKNRDQLQNPTLGNRVWATFAFYHLLWSIASSLFSLRAWQSFSRTFLQVLCGLPLSLGPSTSYSMHFFTQSSSSFRSTCPDPALTRWDWHWSKQKQLHLSTTDCNKMNIDNTSIRNIPALLLGAFLPYITVLRTYCNYPWTRITD